MTRVKVFEVRARVGHSAVNIGQEFIQETDHRVVCIKKHNKLGFKQTSVKSITSDMGYRPESLGEKRPYGGTDYGKLYYWNQIDFY